MNENMLSSEKEFYTYLTDRLKIKLKYSEFKEIFGHYFQVGEMTQEDFTKIMEGQLDYVLEHADERAAAPELVASGGGCHKTNMRLDSKDEEK